MLLQFGMSNNTFVCKVQDENTFVFSQGLPRHSDWATCDEVKLPVLTVETKFRPRSGGVLCVEFTNTHMPD